MARKTLKTLVLLAGLFVAFKALTGRSDDAEPTVDRID